MEWNGTVWYLVQTKTSILWGEAFLIDDTPRCITKESPYRPKSAGQGDKPSDTTSTVSERHSSPHRFPRRK